MQGSAVFSVSRLRDMCGARELVDVEYHDHEGWMVSLRRICRERMPIEHRLSVSCAKSSESICPERSAKLDLQFWI